MDSKYYLASCHQSKENLMKAKDLYGEYILMAEQGIPTFGSLRKQLLPKALTRVQEISQGEADHWKNFKLR